MNLEQLIADNTATMRRMLSALDFIGSLMHDYVRLSDPTWRQRFAAPEPLAATAEEPAVTEAPPEAPPADEPLRYDQVAKAVTDLIKTNRQAGIDLLAQYKAKTLRDIPQEKWAEIKAAAEQLLAPEAA